MSAAISFDFDPSVSILGLPVRLETLALAGVILLGTLAVELAVLWSNRRLDPDSGEHRLRSDDLILIGFGVIPGAIIGGRLDYVLVHLDFYQADPLAMFDPAQGGLALTLGVVAGCLAGVAVARHLAAPVDRWLAVAAAPVMLMLGLGKLALLLGGAGQGSYLDSAWSTRYLGAGPWESANPSFPALPAQAIEAGLVLSTLLLFLLLPSLLRLRLVSWGWFVGPALSERRHWAMFEGGRRFATMVGLWSVVRFAAAFSWRDARVVGPLVTEQLILVLVAVAALAGPEIGRAAARLGRATLSGARRARMALPARRHRVAADEVLTASADAGPAGPGVAPQGGPQEADPPR